MILATRGRGVKFPHLYRPSHLCVGFYPRREDFHPTPEASGPSVVSNSDSSHPLQQTPNVLYQVRDSSGSKKVQEIKMSKMFIILNLLTLPGRSTSRTVIRTAAHGQTASIPNTVFVVDAPFPPRRSFAHVKGAQTDTLRDVRALDAPMVV